MKKITELKRTLYTTNETRNALGERVRVKVPIQMPRPVKTIEGWPRFGHYLIDLVIITALVYALTYAGIIPHKYYPSIDFRIGIRYYQFDLMSYILVVIYYTVLEATMGRTIGKFATNSYVIDEYANQPTTGQIIGRSFSRLIPFFAFSCLAKRGWHDRITKTYVVSKTELEALKKEISGDNGFSDDLDILDA